MPNGDKTGPQGAGPMTGRAAGFCAGANTPGCMNDIPAGAARGMARGFGRGMGRGMGRGNGWGQRAAGRGFGRGRGFGFTGGISYVDGPAAEQSNAASQLEALQLSADRLSQQLNAVQQQINELKKD